MVHFWTKMGKWPFWVKNGKMAQTNPKMAIFFKKKKITIFGSFLTNTGKMIILGPKKGKLHLKRPKNGH